MELIKNKGSLLSLLLIFALGSPVSLIGMETGSGDESSGDESSEETKWTKEDHENGYQIINQLIDGRIDDVRLRANPRLINYVTPDESDKAVAIALAHPRDVQFTYTSNRDLSTPLLVAIDENEPFTLINELLARGANLYLRGATHHIAPFFEAIRYDHEGREKIIEFLVQKDKQIINRPDREGQTPLQFAVLHAPESIVNLLLDLGAVANIDDQDNSGWTALFYAAYRGEVEMVQLLLARGANPNVVDGVGRTADMVASDSSYPRAAQAAALVAGARAASQSSLLGRATSGLANLVRYLSGS